MQDVKWGGEEIYLSISREKYLIIEITNYHYDHAMNVCYMKLEG